MPADSDKEKTGGLSKEAKIYTASQASCLQTRWPGCPREQGKHRSFTKESREFKEKRPPPFLSQGLRLQLPHNKPSTAAHSQAQQPTWKSFQAAGKGSWIKLICGWMWSYPATQVEKEGKAERLCPHREHGSLSLERLHARRVLLPPEVAQLQKCTQTGF